VSEALVRQVRLRGNRLRGIIVAMDMRQSPVVVNTPLGENSFFLEMRCALSPAPVPGQFVELAIDPCLFLRRPFSVSSYRRGTLGILYRVVGRGTHLLSQKKKGDILGVLGPLGRGFPSFPAASRVWLVAGGTGIAPLLFLLSRRKAASGDTTLFYGALTDRALFRKVLPAGNYRKVFSTDDGSCGEKCRITSLVRRHLEQERPDVLCASGPFEMMKEVACLADACGLPCYVSLENRMGCGMGLCFGCVAKVKTDTGWDYERVCTEGPVFPAERVVWEDEDSAR